VNWYFDIVLSTRQFPVFFFFQIYRYLICYKIFLCIFIFCIFIFCIFMFVYALSVLIIYAVFCLYTLLFVITLSSLIMGEEGRSIWEINYRQI
jgi:hypothetical protein